MFTDHYPILSRLPAQERAALVAQAEAGTPLDETQAAALGLPAGCVLLPRGGMTAAQLNTLIDPQRQLTAARDLVAMTQAALRDMEKAS